MGLKFTIGEVPRTKAFQFADLAELAILVQLNSQVSKADLESLIGMGSIDSDPDAEANVADNTDVVEVSAAYARNAEDCFRQFSFRAGALDEHYPFALENSLLTAKGPIGKAGYTYLFCLICSRLASFSGMKGFAQRCAKTFTELSRVALKASLNNAADVYIFDAGTSDRATYFHTDLRLALRRLADKLNAIAIQEVIDQQSSSGDGGLDLVAINHSGDSARGLLAYFGQCAAQQDGWPKKTLETFKSRAFFSMGHPPHQLLYTPVMYRNASGTWINDVHSEGCVIMDRLRVMRAVTRQAVSVPDDVFTAMQNIVDEVSAAVLD